MIDRQVAAEAQDTKRDDRLRVVREALETVRRVRSLLSVSVACSCVLR